MSMMRADSSVVNPVGALDDLTARLHAAVVACDCALDQLAARRAEQGWPEAENRPYEPTPGEEAEYLDLLDRDALLATLAEMEEEAAWEEDYRVACVGRELEQLAREAGGWDRIGLQMEGMVG